MNAFPLTIRAGNRALLGAIALAVATTVGLTAQDTPAGKTPAEKARAAQETMAEGGYTSTDHIVGAKVKLSPDAEAKAEAARNGEKADAPTAKATEWLIDCRDGSLQYAVVSIGGFLGMGDKTVLVPAGELRWNQANEQFQLDWTAQQLEARTPFDLDKACESGLDAAAKTAAASSMSVPKTSQPAAKDASASMGGKVAGTAFVATTCHLCKASTLSSLPVHAGSEQFGKVDDLIIDRSKHDVVLAVVRNDAILGVGGTSYLVPFAKLTPCAKDGEAGDLTALCAANTTKDELAKSVVYEKPKSGVVDPAAAKQALSKATSRE